MAEGFPTAWPIPACSSLLPRVRVPQPCQSSGRAASSRPFRSRSISPSTRDRHGALFLVNHNCFEPVQVLYGIRQLRNKLTRLPVADDDFQVFREPFGCQFCRFFACHLYLPLAFLFAVEASANSLEFR